MERERWLKIESLYHSALEREASARPEFLRLACAGDDPSPNKKMQSNLAYLVSMKCQLIICGCRTKGETVEALESLRKNQYDLGKTPKRPVGAVSHPPTEEQEAASNKMAELKVEKVDSAISDVTQTGEDTVGSRGHRFCDRGFFLRWEKPTVKRTLTVATNYGVSYRVPADEAIQPGSHQTDDFAALLT